MYVQYRGGKEGGKRKFEKRRGINGKERSRCAQVKGRAEWKERYKWTARKGKRLPKGVIPWPTTSTTLHSVETHDIRKTRSRTTTKILAPSGYPEIYVCMYVCMYVGGIRVYRATTKGTVWATPEVLMCTRAKDKEPHSEREIRQIFVEIFVEKVGKIW